MSVLSSCSSLCHSSLLVVVGHAVVHALGHWLVAAVVDAPWVIFCYLLWWESCGKQDSSDSSPDARARRCPHLLASTIMCAVLAAARQAPEEARKAPITVAATTTPRPAASSMLLTDVLISHCCPPLHYPGYLPCSPGTSRAWEKCTPPRPLRWRLAARFCASAAPSE